MALYLDDDDDEENHFWKFAVRARHFSNCFICNFIYLLSLKSHLYCCNVIDEKTEAQKILVFVFKALIW